MDTIWMHRFPLAHTFSIVAQDANTGDMGVAVQSHWFSVGSLVTWGEAGVGVVATQSMVDPSYGPLGLELLRAGKTPEEALRGLLAADSGRGLRQVAILDVQGRVAAHTGERCIRAAGHLVGKGFSVQANMMANDSVWPAMASSYQTADTDLPLADRLLAALRAAQASGGDIRGQQSAAILIVKPVSTGKPWADRVMELRVEDHIDPIGELSRLVRIQQAYEWMNQGDDQLGRGETAQALQAYSTAAGIAPEIDELPFWHAVTLADLGQVDDALPIFRVVFAVNPDWAVLLQRLPAAGLLRQDDEMIKRILAEIGGQSSQ